jgi:hypothetical protein
MRRRVRSTVAAAAPSRTCSTSRCQELAVIGNPSQIQPLSRARAASSVKSNCNVRHAGSTGITLSDTSQITPKMPMEPARTRETSYPATFFITCPPKVSASPMPFRSVAPST